MVHIPLLLPICNKGHMDHATAIVEQCPQLGLEAFLATREPGVEYEYAAIERWIDSVSDEKQRTKIETWAEMVEDREMNEDVFRRKVQKLIGG